MKMNEKAIASISINEFLRDAATIPIGSAIAIDNSTADMHKRIVKG